MSIAHATRQQALAYAMGKGGRAMPAWVAADDDARAEFERGRADATGKAGGADTPEAARPEADRAPAMPRVTTAGERVGRGTAAGAQPDDTGADGTAPLVKVELTWQQAKRQARDYGRRGEALPDFLAEHASLRRQHRAGQRDVVPWRSPFGG